MHYHNHVELLYGVEGIASAVIGNKMYRFDKGDMLIVNSKYAHDVVCESGTVKYYVVQFLPEGMYLQGQSLAEIRYLFPLWEKELDRMPLVTASELEGSGTGLLIQDIMNEWKNKERGYEAIIYADIIKIFISMIRRRKPNSREKSPITGELQSALAHAVEAARENLHDFSGAVIFPTAIFAEASRRRMESHFHLILNQCGSVKRRGSSSPRKWKYSK